MGKSGISFPEMEKSTLAPKISTAIPYEVALRKQWKRQQLSAFFARLAPCLIGLEASGGAHFWARKLTELGYTSN